MSTPAHERPPLVEYPDSDGEPMADNTEQFEFIQLVQGNLDSLLPDFVAGDHLWYPVEGHPEIRRAPDVYVAMGRPKGHRGSYRQWVEDGVPLTVVFEWWSPNSTFSRELLTHQFYERHGVRELYTWSQVRREFSAFVRNGDRLEPVDTSEGWTSPLLHIRFEVVDGALQIYRPDGTPFRSFRELQAERDAAAAERDAAAAERDAAAAERDAALARAEALAARLRALGIDP
jgi:hypothetical protein